MLKFGNADTMFDAGSGRTAAQKIYADIENIFRKAYGKGSTDNEREMCLSRALKMCDKHQIPASMFDHLKPKPAAGAKRDDAAPEPGPWCEQCGTYAKHGEPAHNHAKPKPKPKPKPAAKPESEPAGDRDAEATARRNWTSSALKLARQRIWSYLSADEIAAHRERCAVDATHKSAWLATIATMASADAVPDEIATVTAWASWAKAA